MLSSHARAWYPSSTCWPRRMTIAPEMRSGSVGAVATTRAPLPVRLGWSAPFCGVSPASSVTDAQGLARTAYLAGTVGTHQVLARAPAYGNTGVVFTERSANPVISAAPDNPTTGTAPARLNMRVVLETWKELPKYWKTSLRSSLVGCLMGIVPGGATPASFMSYGVAKRMSRDGEKFGTGQIEGVVAPETVAHAAAAGFDMVGALRDDKLVALGSESAPEWKGLLDRTAAELKSFSRRVGTDSATSLPRF